MCGYAGFYDLIGKPALPCNIGVIDQVSRAVLGRAFVAWYVRGSGITDSMDFAGACLLATALFLYCPRHGALGLSTHGRLDRTA
jgi:hypothetical protein